ncbi:MAG: AAA domain-containing protein [Planctomycetota bacterium]|nr:AAA domain-containing protein [Planctomycetota bacterium]
MRRPFEKSRRDDVPLGGILSEFRTALQEEIEAASRSESSAAVPLANGRRIAQVGASYQYVFDIENALNLPGDAPGDLYLPGSPPVEVTILSVDGLAVTLSVPQDIGVFVPVARLQSNLTFLMRKLIERIEGHAQLPNVVGERVRGALPASGEPALVDLAALCLNSDQCAAVASSLGRNTTFIWGPPGTGKSRTIGAIAGQLLKCSRSVLLVSHTNIAVDGALHYIKQYLAPDLLSQGRVLRVGDPKDQRIANCPDLLLQTHVDHRSEELAGRRETLSIERARLAEEVRGLCRAIDICEWLSEAQTDLGEMTRKLGEVQTMEADLENARAEESHLADTATQLAAAASAASEAQRNMTELARLEKDIAETTDRCAAAGSEVAEAKRRLAEAEQIMAKAEEIAPLRGRARDLPPVDVLTQRVEQTRVAQEKARQEHEGISARLARAEALHADAQSVGKLTRLWRGLPSPESLGPIVANFRAGVKSAWDRVQALNESLAGAEQLLAKKVELQKKLQPYANIPESHVQQQVVNESRNVFESLQAEINRLNHNLHDLTAVRALCAAVIQIFFDDYPDGPEEVIQKANENAAALAEVRARGFQLMRECGKSRPDLEQLLEARLAVLREWNLTEELPGPAEKMLVAARAACERALSEVRGCDLNTMLDDRIRLNERIIAIDAQTRDIEEALKRVEELVIADATVVATTLTRAYLRDSIQKRRFDTVVLDEASMAPIPALWVAAGLADCNAVVVGDFKQLPPIVISKHPLALKWLGRDIFEEAVLTNPDAAPDRVVILRRQYRMHPQISAIPNELIYEGRLWDDDMTKSDGNLTDWYRRDWGYDEPVLLVDTGPLGAWVTSVPRAARSSRLNFLSATICVDIAEQLLRRDRPEFQVGHDPRILIVCPYRPHARLLELLLRKQGLAGEVLAGTAHSFQGSEADVVILDLVNDEPHWRVGLFMPERDETNKRLLNVALTRARRRLVVVGDFDYNVKRAKRAFMGAKLIPFLVAHYPRVSAVEVVPTGLSARAAKAQSLVLGGDVEPQATRLVVTQERFFPVLRGDLARAASRIVIYSAFITQARLALLEPQIRAAIERQVRVYVVTKTHGDRNKKEVPGYRALEKALSDWGVVVVHKRGMHEKLIFIDDNILWSGSLNPLSFSDTQEIMERRESREVVKDFAGTLRLDDLVGEYDAGPPVCPICDGEMVASEGDRKPFYWRCMREDCCYRRDIDQPPIKGGVIVCSNCGREVEYGEWGGKPAWRCVEKRHHHQSVAPMHLRLPKMRERVPKKELRRLDKLFGIAPVANPKRFRGHTSLEEGTRGPIQGSLFSDDDADGDPAAPQACGIGTEGHGNSNCQDVKEVDAETFSLMVEIGGLYLKHGMLDFEEWSVLMTQGEGEVMRPYLQRVYQAALREHREAAESEPGGQ